MICREFDNLPRFELKEALQLCMDSMEFLKELADVFVSESPPCICPGFRREWKKRILKK